MRGGAILLRCDAATMAGHTGVGSTSTTTSSRSAGGFQQAPSATARRRALKPAGSSGKKDGDGGGGGGGYLGAEAAVVLALVTATLLVLPLLLPPLPPPPLLFLFVPVAILAVLLLLVLLPSDARGLGVAVNSPSDPEVLPISSEEICHYTSYPSQEPNDEDYSEAEYQFNCDQQYQQGEPSVNDYYDDYNDEPDV